MWDYKVCDYAYITADASVKLLVSFVMCNTFLKWAYGR